MTITLTKPKTQIVWRSPTPGDKTTSIPGSVPGNKGFALHVKTTLGNGDTHTVTPTSGTIGGQPNFTFTDENCDLSLVSDADNADWIIRCLCCLAMGDAVYFDGQWNSLSTSSVVGAVDNPRLTFSFWIAALPTETNPNGFSIFNATPPGIGNDQFIQSPDFANISLNVADTVGNKNAFASWAVPTDGQFHNVLFSVDVSSPTLRINAWLDETDTFSGAVIPAGPWDFAFAGFGFGLPDQVSMPNEKPFSLCWIGDFWYAQGQYVDFSIMANRLKFHNANGTPVPVSSLGANGELITGTAPTLFMTGGAGSFGTNRGTGGPLTTRGSLVDSLIGLHNVLPTPATTRGWARLAGNVNIEMLAPHVLRADSRYLTASIWLRMNSLQTATALLFSCYHTAFGGLLYEIDLDTSGNLVVHVGDAGSNQITFTQTSNEIAADGAKHNVLIAADSQAGTLQLYVDDVLASFSIVGSGGFNIPYSLMTGISGLPRFFGRGSDVTNPEIGRSYVGDAAEFWFDTDNIDFSVASNRQKFISSGNSVNLGSDGSTPTGSPPLFYLSQQPADYAGVTFLWNRARGNRTWNTTGLGGGLITVGPQPYP